MMRHQSKAPRRSRPAHNGSAIVLCILAIAVISLASVTIVRSHRRMNFRRSAIKARSHGRLIADGLIHREIAFTRQPSLAGRTPLDPDLKTMLGFENAQAVASNFDATGETMTVQVLLYPGAPVATTRRQLNISND